MTEIIVKPPKPPELCLPQVRHPKAKTGITLKTPKVTINKRAVFGGLYNGIFKSKRDVIKTPKDKISVSPEDKTSLEKNDGLPISAGRGGIHYGKTSNMGRIAESADKRTRQAKKEIKPYKPMAQMHTLHSLKYIQEFGIQD